MLRKVINTHKHLPYRRPKPFRKTQKGWFCWAGLRPYLDPANSIHKFVSLTRPYSPILPSSGSDIATEEKCRSGRVEKVSISVDRQTCTSSSLSWNKSEWHSCHIWQFIANLDTFDTIWLPKFSFWWLVLFGYFWKFGLKLVLNQFWLFLFWGFLKFGYFFLVLSSNTGEWCFKFSFLQIV